MLDSLARHSFHIESVTVGDNVWLHAQSVGHHCQQWTNTEFLSQDLEADKIYCIKVMITVHQL